MDLRNILIFRIGHLGDTVIALPALWAIRHAFPEARLTLLTNIDRKNPHYVSPADVLPKAGLIDDVIAYPTNLGIVSNLGAYLDLMKKLRREKFDAAFYMMPRVRSAIQIKRDRIFLKLAGIGDLLGSDFLIRERLEFPVPLPSPEVESESDFLLRLLENSGVRSDKIETDLLLTDDEISVADNWLENAVTSAEKTLLIAVAPGSKLAAKMWPEEHYIEVLAHLIEKYNCHPIIFGGREDQQKGDRMIGSLGRGSNAAGELNVRESAALLRNCKLYLGNDTGTMHLAAAVGVPCVAIFATLDWKGRWIPFGSANRIFRGGENASAGSNPLDQIKGSEVFDACSDLLAHT